MVPPAPITNNNSGTLNSSMMEEKQNIEIIRNNYKYTYDVTEECIYKESIAADSKHIRVKISNIPEQASLQINHLKMEKRRQLIEQIIINTEKQLEEIYRNTSIARPEF